MNLVQVVLVLIVNLPDVLARACVDIFQSYDLTGSYTEFCGSGFVSVELNDNVHSFRFKCDRACTVVFWGGVLDDFSTPGPKVYNSEEVSSGSFTNDEVGGGGVSYVEVQYQDFCVQLFTGAGQTGTTTVKCGKAFLVPGPMNDLVLSFRLLCKEVECQVGFWKGYPGNYDDGVLTYNSVDTTTGDVDVTFGVSGVSIGEYPTQCIDMFRTTDMTGAADEICGSSGNVEWFTPTWNNLVLSYRLKCTRPCFAIVWGNTIDNYNYFPGPLVLNSLREPEGEIQGFGVSNVEVRSFGVCLQLFQELGCTGRTTVLCGKMQQTVPAAFNDAIRSVRFLCDKKELCAANLFQLVYGGPFTRLQSDIADCQNLPSEFADTISSLVIETFDYRGLGTAYTYFIKRTKTEAQEKPLIIQTPTSNYYDCLFACKRHVFCWGFHLSATGSCDYFGSNAIGNPLQTNPTKTLIYLLP